MSEEDYLVYLLRGFRLGIEGNLLCASDNDDTPSLYMDGYSAALNQSLGALDATLRLYKAKKEGKIPPEMIEIAEREKDS